MGEQFRKESIHDSTHPPKIDGYMEQVAYDEGYLSPEEMANHHPELFQRHVLEANTYFEAQESPGEVAGAEVER